MDNVRQLFGIAGPARSKECPTQRGDESPVRSCSTVPIENPVKPRRGLGMTMSDVTMGYAFTREKGYELLAADIQDGTSAVAHLR